jgi:hypothetical protein
VAVLTRARTARTVALLAIVCEALSLLLLPAARREPVVRFIVARCGSALLVAACAAVGLLIVTRGAGNLVGWVLLAASACHAAGELTGAYAARAQTTAPPLPGGALAAWVTDPTWNASVPIGAILVLLLFPTGRPPSPRWRPVIWAAAVATAVATVGAALTSGPADVEAAGPVLDAVVSVASSALVACLVAAVASLLVRWGRAGGVERQQLRWLASAAALLVIVSASGPLVPHLLYQAAVLVAALLLPVAMAAAILRDRSLRR